MEKNKRDFDMRPQPRHLGTPIHHRRATIQREWSNLQRDTGDVKKLKSRPPHLQHQRQTKRPSRKKEDELDYDIDQPAAPPLNPFRVFPVANIQPVIGILARRERWLLALLAYMFLEPPGIATDTEWEDSPSLRQVGGAHFQEGRGRTGGGQEMVPASPRLSARNDPK